MKKSTMKLFILTLINTLFIFSVHSNQAFSATFDRFPYDDGTYKLLITGEIQKGDYDTFVKTLKDNGFPNSIVISSIGGNIVEAMMIGELIRSAGATIWPIRQCDSACALIVLASVKLDTESDVLIGLHRPRFQAENYQTKSLREIEVEQDKLNKAVAAYLLKMNAPEEVIKKILTTPSNDMYHIPLGLIAVQRGAKAPAYDEWLRASCGTLSVSEEKDAYDLMMLEVRMKICKIDDSCDVFIASNRDLVNKINSFSTGYANYLMQSYEKYEECEIEIVDRERDRIIYELRN